MAEADFFVESGRKRIAEAIGEAESRTAAEIVVQVRHVAGRHRDADYLWGALTALLVLLVLLFSPRPFRVIGFPFHLALGFAAGTFASSRLSPLRRLLVTRRAARFEVERAARAAFHDLRIDRTSGRWGLLVLVATFERRVEVVTDLGIDTEALGAPWQAAVTALSEAVARADLAAFTEGVRALGPLLAGQHPHRSDDIDELPDAVEEEPIEDFVFGGPR